MTTEQIQMMFNIVNALGSIGTLGAFIFLFLKDKTKEKQIEALSILVGLLSEQNRISEKRLRLTINPDLWLNGANYSATDGRIFKINLNNKGEAAFLDKIKLISGDIILHNISLPYELEKDKHRYISGIVNEGKNAENFEYEIEVEYHDKLNYKYSIVIQGKGTLIKIKSKNEIQK